MELFNFIGKTSYTFEGKKDDEQVILFLHRHWFTLFNKVFIICIASLFPLLALVLFGSLLIEYSLIPLFTFFWAAYVMFLWYALFYSLTMYTLDYWIVTNERIVNSVQSGFFNRRVAELSISTIQDVSSSLHGVVATTMNFGDVEVQTAAREGHFLFEQVPNPQEVKDKVMYLMDQIEDRKEHSYHDHRPQRPA